MHEAKFQGRGRAEDFLGADRILDTGQLHHDPAVALALNHGLGNAELVDAVLQRRDILFHGGTTLFLERGLVIGDVDERAAVVAAIGEYKIAVLVLEHRPRGIALAGVDEAHGNLPAIGLHRPIAQFFLAHEAAQLVGVALQRLADGRIHVDFHQKVHTAAQVEAEIHRQRVQRGKPVGGCRREVERNRIAAVRGFQNALDLGGRAQLLLFRFEAHQYVLAIQLDRPVVEVFGVDQSLDQAEFSLVDEVDAVRNLHRGIFAVQVGRGVNGPDHDDQDQEKVSPGGVAVNHIV